MDCYWNNCGGGCKYCFKCIIDASLCGDAVTKALLNDNRIDDLKRALEDPAFRQKLLEEYGID